MSSSRNMAIIGLSIMVGIMIPIYIRETKDPIKTGTPNLFILGQKIVLKIINGRAQGVPQ